ncbi:MAG: MFS transporter, partial [Candidatus Eiseniibacteriota bacterium]
VVGAAVSAASLFVFQTLKLPAAGALHAGLDPPLVPAGTAPAAPFPLRDALPRVGLVALWMLGPALVAPFFNLYFSREHGLSIERVGFVFAAATAAWALAVLVSGEIAGRIGAQRLMAWAPLFFAPLMLGLALAGSAPIAVGLFALQGMISPVLNPLIDQWLLGLTPPEHRGAISGWRQVAADVSAMVGASVGGVLLAAGAFDALFLSAGAIGLVGALGLAAGARTTRQLRAVDP